MSQNFQDQLFLQNTSGYCFLAFLSQKKQFGFCRANLPRLVSIFTHSECSTQNFGRLQDKIMGNYNIGRIFLKRFKFCLAFPKYWFCVCPLNLAFSSLIPIFNGLEDLIQAFNRIQSKFIGSFNMGNSVLGSFKGYLPFQEKWFGIC